MCVEARAYIVYKFPDDGWYPQELAEMAAPLRKRCCLAPYPFGPFSGGLLSFSASLGVNLSLGVMGTVAVLPCGSRGLGGKCGAR